MAEPEGSMTEVYVQPGEVHLVDKPAIMRTLLGSCVGITFLGSAARHCSALPSHAAALSCQSGEHRSLCAGRRYVDFAIRDMAQQLDSLGLSIAERCR